MSENYFVEKIEHDKETYTVTHNVTAAWGVR